MKSSEEFAYLQGIEACKKHQKPKNNPYRYTYQTHQREFNAWRDGYNNQAKAAYHEAIET